MKRRSFVDIYWLGLKLGEDFSNVIDLMYMFCYKQFTINPNELPSLRNYRGITTFSLRQVVLTLMGIDIQVIFFGFAEKTNL